MAPKLLRVDQPSIGDLETAISSLDKIIAEVETQDHKDLGVRIKLADANPKTALVADYERKMFDRMEALLAQLRKEKTAFKQYLDPRKRYLGEVVFGSGLNRTCRPTHRTEDSVPSIRDWALIRITPDRKGENKIFTYGQPLLAQDSDMLLPINTGQRGKLFKSGGPTQFTEGGYSELRQVVIVKGLDLHGREAPFSSFQHSIASFGNTVFAYPGDSGSFVYTQFGEVVGLLVRSWERMNVTVFQRIFDVFEDIKKVTGAIDVRIMEH